VSPFQEFGNAFVEMFNPQKIFININNVAFDYSVPAASAGILVDPNDPFA
jgi:hypothetical protein